ncbi:MAG TPA: RagB/SusD family nutrient uptake outer membrane protein [Flavisolibacter sp.]|nr:RagB/SusD family nutrient uptake outer membrane protein [Flavisolibacter sp.]
MKKLIINMLAMGVVVLSFPSCKKELNALPGQAKVEGNVIVDERSAQVALNGAYYRFAGVAENFTTGLPSTQWSWDHEIYPSSMAGSILYYQGPYIGAENDFTSESYETAGMWRTYYNLVNAANAVIKELGALSTSKISETRKGEILAEARFLRGYGHYALLCYFGEFYNVGSKYGVLLRKEPVTVSNISQSRSTVQESYDFILADIDDAIAHIKDGNPNYYASKWAAMALKMRILMNRGAAGDYTEVISLANNIIASGPYQLEADVKDIFKTKGLGSGEVILGTKAYPNQPSEMEVYYYRGRYQFYATDSLASYLKNDPRLDWVITVDHTNPYMPYTNAFSKYLGPQSETKYAFRLTEVYLLKAEAIVRSGGSLTDAKTIVKDVMSHAGVTDFSTIDNATTADTLLIEIYKEIARNLVAEDGADWFALLRLPFETVKQIKPSIQNKFQYILPIPKAEHDKNPAIGEQNPGYGW